MAKPADFKKVVAQMKKMKQADFKKFNDEWAAWGKGKGVWNMGAPVGKNMRVKKAGVSAARNEIGGYSIITAKTHAEAAQKMRSNPHLKLIPKGWIDVMEMLRM